jgi:uncharacterized protein (TIGR03086 family)
MTDIADRYRRRAGVFVEKVAAVPEERWGDQSPCEDWKARDVVRHVVDTSGMFLGFVGEEAGEAPSVDDDPLGAIQAATGEIATRLDDPEVAERTFEGFFGETSFEASVDRFLSADLVIHAWDLARATGQDDTIPPDEVEVMWAGAHEFDPDAMRSPGAFGPEVEAPEGASGQDRLLAFLGRRP